MGSSPRGRGKLGGLHPGRSVWRLIPARAGKTFRDGGQSDSCAAHPRAGGENMLPNRLTSNWTGSSPRGRGKLAARCGLSDLGRLIPARAGKTAGGPRHRRERPAHPRAGGENSASVLQIVMPTGSSPRGRGKPPRTIRLYSCHRLIPARAGKTACQLMLDRIRAAHPRAGGENPPTFWKPSSAAGSSPRGRGKRGHDARHAQAPGLIPARAGKTTRRRPLP